MYWYDYTLFRRIFQGGFVIIRLQFIYSFFKIHKIWLHFEWYGYILVWERLLVLLLLGCQWTVSGRDTGKWITPDVIPPPDTEKPLSIFGKRLWLSFPFGETFVVSLLIKIHLFICDVHGFADIQVIYYITFSRRIAIVYRIQSILSGSAGEDHRTGHITASYVPRL